MNAVSKSLQSDSNSNPEGIILDLNDLSHANSQDNSHHSQTNSPENPPQNILHNSLLTLSQLKAHPEEDPEPPKNPSITDKKSRLEQFRKKRERIRPVENIIEPQPSIPLQKLSSENKETEPENSLQKCSSPDPNYQPLNDKSSPNQKLNSDQTEFDLQSAIDQAEEFGTIYLPEKVIKVNELTITKPIVIIGSTGCTIEVSHSIHVNLLKYHEPDQRIIFLECTFEFEYTGGAIQKVPVNQSLSTKRIALFSFIKIFTSSFQ